MHKLFTRIAQAAGRLRQKKEREPQAVAMIDQHETRIIHQEEEMRRFKSHVVGTLTEPRLAKGILFGGWTANVVSVALWWILGVPVIATLSIIFITFILGIRRIPTVHCGLLYNWGRRTRIGFWEGLVWIPWMTGGQLKIFNVEKFSYDIEKEDTWSTDQMHLNYDIVFRFGVIPVVEKTAWTNFVWYFHALFNTNTYKTFKAEASDLGQGLFTFVENPDVENALAMIVAYAKQCARQVFRGKSFKDIFQFNEGNPVVDEEKVGELNHELEDRMKARLQPLVQSIGLRVTDFSLADIDLNDEAIETLQQEQLAVIRAKAQRLNYNELIEIGKKLSLDPRVGEAVLRTEVLRAFQRASESGLLGTLLHGTALEKMEALTSLQKQ